MTPSGSGMLQPATMSAAQSAQASSTRGASGGREADRLHLAAVADVEGDGDAAGRGRVTGAAIQLRLVLADLGVDLDLVPPHHPAAPGLEVERHGEVGLAVAALGVSEVKLARDGQHALLHRPRAQAGVHHLGLADRAVRVHVELELDHAGQVAAVTQLRLVAAGQLALHRRHAGLDVGGIEVALDALDLEAVVAVAVAVVRRRDLRIDGGRRMSLGVVLGPCLVGRAATADHQDHKQGQMARETHARQGGARTLFTDGRAHRCGRWAAPWAAWGRSRS